MKHFDLESLVKGDDGLYKLTRTTYSSMNKQRYESYQHIVTNEQEMRIDLVSDYLYNDVDYCDFLLNFNGITDPLSIKEGDTINYVDSSTIESFRVNDTSTDDVKAKLLNNNKISKKDKGRQDYVNTKYSLPPTINDEPIKQVKIEGDTIIIGGNLFR